MGQNLIDYHDWLEKRRTGGLFDDFWSYTDTQLWTKGVTSSGTVVIATTGVNGLLQLATTTTQGSEAWVQATNKFFQFNTGKPLLYEARINYQEANVNTCGIYAGFSSAFATGLLATNGTVPKNNFSGCGIYKLSGQTNWNAITSVGTTQLTNASAQQAGGANDEILRVQVEIIGSTAEVTFFVDTGSAGLIQLQETSSGYLKPIKHRIAFSSAAVMSPGIYLIEGGASASVAQTLNLDYIAVEQLRTTTT